MFISDKNAINMTQVNTQHICYFELNGKKIQFYFTAMTARLNWDYKTEEDAEKGYNALIELLKTKNI